MTSIRSRTSRLTERLGPALEEFRDRLATLGLCLTVYDADACVVDRGVGGPFCELRASGDCGCCDSLAAEVAREGRRAVQRSGCGCCAIGLPLMQRRRVLGTVVACYPPLELLDEEAFARFCDAHRLDRRAAEGPARQQCRHGRAEVEDLANVAEWLLEGAQSRRTSEQEIATLSHNLSTTYEELSLLYAISGSMGVAQKAESFIRGVCDELREVINVETTASVVYAYPPEEGAADLVVLSGDSLEGEQVRRLADAEIAERLAAHDGRPLVENRFEREQCPFDGALRNYLAAPLRSGGETMGVLIALNKVDDEFDSVDLKLLGSISKQVSIFLANRRLYEDIQDLLMGVLHALTSSIDAKDPYTCGHSRRVAMLSRFLAEEAGLPPERVERIYLSGLLHDVGKIGVAESTLCKDGRLTDDEFADIKRHPVVGSKILGGIRQLQDVVDGILYHHERIDGRGYPNGLSGDELSLAARIVCIADCFDAMTSDRTYRKALPLEVVIEEIRTNAGTQFDPGLVEAFLSLDLAGFLKENGDATQRRIAGEETT